MTTATKCVWHRDAETDIYESSCRNSFYFVDGTLRDQGGFKFCPYCSLEIEPDEPPECAECGSEFDLDAPRQILCYLCKKDDEPKQDTE